MLGKYQTDGETLSIEDMTYGCRITFAECSCPLTRDKDKQKLFPLYNFLRRSGEGGAGLFSLVSKERMHRNGTKLCQERFRTDIMKNVFTMKVIKQARMGFLVR